jgi:hypothetical protein
MKSGHLLSSSCPLRNKSDPKRVVWDNTNWVVSLAGAKQSARAVLGEKVTLGWGRAPDEATQQRNYWAA